MVTAHYLDSSVAVHALLAPRGRAGRWLSTRAAAGERFIASRLLQTEVSRVLRREDLPPARADALLVGVGLIPISEEILVVAESIRPHLRTLDAIHLATAVHTMLGPTMLTHDTRLAEVAAAVGLATYDPV